MDAHDHLFTRRSLLGAGLAATAVGIATATLGGPQRAMGMSTSPGRGLSLATAPLAEGESALDADTLAATTQHHRPGWARPWKKPIYSVNDFLHRSPHTQLPGNAIMLTIDDGPSPEWTHKYLRLFARHGISATFCMIGCQVLPNRRIVRDVALDGHHIANHTWTHDELLPTRSITRIRREIHDTSHAIVEASGFVPRQFRAPGGNWGPRVFAEVSRAGMMPLDWDVDPRDWAFPGTAAIRDAMLAAGPHDIILCHDGGGDRSQTYAALETVVPRLKSVGYEFVTLPAPHTL